MKAESNLRPMTPFVLNELSNGTTEVIFYENVKDISDGEAERYLYDTYTVTVPSRWTLQKDIEENYVKWLDYAKSRAQAPAPMSAAEQLASLEADNRIMGAALEEVISIIAGGDA